MIKSFSYGRRLIAKNIPDNSLKHDNALKKQVSPSKPLTIIPLDTKKLTVLFTSTAKIPEPQYFERLKFEEHRQFYNKRRTRYTYAQNYSAALELPCSRIDLQHNHNNRGMLLSLSKDNIIEHANRRVDLYFYTLVAYYKTLVYPTSGHTNLQHGRGRTVDGDLNLTQACHSSFTPSLVDNTIYKNNGSRIKHKSLLSGTHLMNNLNATVELPPFVNELDDVLESACRQKSIELLGDASLGTISPIEGLSIFLKMMKEVLDDLKSQSTSRSMSHLNRHSQFSHKRINPKLIDLVLSGTLKTTYSTENESVSDDYIQLLLRLTPDEKKLCAINKDNKEKIYLNKIMDIQNEILETRSSLNYPTT
jgi:hypothetical protein